ncbi:MAG: response regulator transcription factor [Actinomycetota bacterium]|nr:response regulator transcription factor [Actinomycetota bacterium]
MGDESETDRKARDECLRVVVADDDPFARRVIREALVESGMLVVAEARNGREAVELACNYRPDVVIMDLVMPELDGIGATREILKVVPDQLVIVLTGANEGEELGLLALRAGAAGFLSKDVDIDALPRTLEAARAGEVAISRRMTKRVIEQLRSAGDSYGVPPVKSPLTPREWEVIGLLKAARSTNEIAADLTLSTETVRFHVKNILRKLQARSRQEAVDLTDRIAAGRRSREWESTAVEGGRRRGGHDRRRSTLQRP